MINNNIITEGQILNYIDSTYDLIYESSDNGSKSFVKKLVIRNKIRKTLKKIFKIAKDNIKIEISIKKLESQKEKADKDKKDTIKLKISVLEKKKKNNDDYMSNIKDNTKKLADKEGLPTYYTNRMQIINTKISELELKIIDDPKKKQKALKKYKIQKLKSDELLKKEEETNKN